jgi:thiamine biosynthesis lipoprotein
MGIYILLSRLRINLVLCLSLAACGAEPRAPLSRVWPAMGTMMSAAAWGTDSARLARALDAAHDSVDRIDSLVQRRVRFAALDSVQREIRSRTGVVLSGDSIAAGYALDRAALALVGVADSALLDVGGQYLWIGTRPTHRFVGIPDPANSLRTLAVVEMRSGSIRTKSRAPGEEGGVRAVTVLAPDGLTTGAWSAAFLLLGCDRALAMAQRMGVVCADSAGVRWTTDLQNRVSLPIARGP